MLPTRRSTIRRTGRPSCVTRRSRSSTCRPARPSRAARCSRNAWRPAHIHFSLLGRTFEQRLVTQMYFPGDPLFEYDPIFNSVRDPRARERMVAGFSIDATQPDWALGYEFDVVLRGQRATPFEE